MSRGACARPAWIWRSLPRVSRCSRCRTVTSAGGGTWTKGEPHGLPGSYLNGVYEERPLPYAEAAYGLPESGQTVINVTNGKVIRLLVDDEPFDVRYGVLRAHERVLDFRAEDGQPECGVDVAGGPHGPGYLGSAGVVHPAGDGGGQLPG